MATVGVLLPQGESGGRGAPDDDLGLSIAVQVSRGSRRENAVRAEPRPAREHRAGGCVEGVGLLIERAGHDVGAALEVGHGQPRLHAVGPRRIRGRFDHWRGPQLRPGRPVPEVASDARVCGVAPTHEHIVQPAGGEGRDRRRRVDRDALVIYRPAGYGRPVGQVVGVEVTSAVADHHGGTAAVQGGLDRRRLGDRLHGVRGEGPGGPLQGEAGG